MIQKINEPVSVTLNFSHKTRRAVPKEVTWGNKTYPIIKIGLHHTFFEGRVLHHVFSVVSYSVFFRLVLNTQTLFWTLTELDDGLGG